MKLAIYFIFATLFATYVVAGLCSLGFFPMVIGLIAGGLAFLPAYNQARTYA